tara:strand:+ start:8910 stop:9923 length:1014 start_codon:yes stop_codon:yes gene_type:complete
MNSKKQSAASKRATEDWHRQNDHLVYAELMHLARPEQAPQPRDDDQELVDRLIGIFEERCPPLDSRDVIGLVVLRLTSEFWPPGTPQDLDVELANLKALALTTASASGRMNSSGFAVPKILHPQAAHSLLMVQAQAIRHRWLNWYRELLDPYEQPTGNRQTTAHALANQHCLRPANNEQGALKESKRLLDGYFRRKGRGKANLETDDILSELHTLDRGQVGKARLLRLREDGRMEFDARKIRDVLRKLRHSSAGTELPGTHDSLEASGSDVSQQTEYAELVMKLIDLCDDDQIAIVNDWESSNAHLAKQLDVSPTTIANKRAKLCSLAARIDSDSNE